MFLAVYIFLATGLLLHFCYSLKALLGTPKVTWNYDRHAIVVMVMLVLIATTNAAAAFYPHLIPASDGVLPLLFGVGHTKGIMLLGLVGIYWAAVFVFCGVMRVRHPMSQHREPETVKLPPGGLVTIWLSMLLVIGLVCLMVWGTT